MAKEGLFQGLPMWAKGVVAIAVVGGIGVVGYTIYKSLKKITDKGKDDTPKETVNLAAQDYDALFKQGQKITFAPSNYAAASEAIVKLLDGCETLSSEIDAMGEVIRVVKKPIDWYYLIKVFGQKDIADCGTWGSIKTRYSLVGLLKDQLDSFMTVYANYKIGGWVVPKGVYNDTRDILSAYLKTVGVTTF